jgi:hypothetical protein
MESEAEDDVNSDGEFWKTEPIETFEVTPKFIPLIPFEKDHIEQLAKLKSLDLEDNNDFLESTQLINALIEDFINHIYSS